MKSNKEFIEGIYKKYEKQNNNEKEFERIKKQPKNHLTIKILSLVAMFIVIFSTVLIYQNHINIINLQLAENPNNEEFTEVEEKINLPTIDNFENFCNIIKTAKLNNETNRDDINSSKAESTLEESLQDEKHSNTNVQVEGVDEADIVKTDGNYLYYISNQKIYIVDIKTPEQSKIVKKIEFANTEIIPSELYVNKNRLIVIGNSYGGVMYEVKSASTQEKAVEQPKKNKTIVIVYDITTKEEPKEERHIEINGFYLSSRMIGNSIYFTSNYYLSNIRNIKSYPAQELNEKDFMVSYKDTKISEEEKNIDFNKVHYFDNMEDINYLSLVGFNLDNKEEADIQTFLGAGDRVYCSLKNMYVEKTQYSYVVDENNRVTNSSNSTKIFKFKLADGKIKFRAEAEVPGIINNQFSMDENEEGYFRIATTINDSWTTTDNTSNSLYIFDKNLKLVGKLENLAKGEQIYSVRYIKDKAYIVTFKQVDPLFVIDLSENENPKVLGQLKIPGYSTYLHPYDENHIIGFGYNTKADGSRTTNEGLKMSMFDVTDVNNPKEMFKVDIGNRYTSSELTYNHKSLLYLKDKNIIAFPMMTYNRNTNSTARFYEISLKDGFILKSEISHGSDYKNHIERIVFSNNYYFTISDNLIKIIRANDYKEIGNLNLN